MVTKQKSEQASAELFWLAEATALLRMAVSGPQLDSLLFAQFQPDHAQLDAHARLVTTIFLRGIEPWPGESREVKPAADIYGYPWLPGADGRP